MTKCLKFVGKDCKRMHFSGGNYRQQNRYFVKVNSELR